MLFNFTYNYQFGTRLELGGENIEMVNKMKLLGTWINSNLTWDENCAYLVKKVNNRMILLRSILSFGASNTEMVHFWIVFCRSILEQCCELWHASLTQENKDDLERTQKTFVKLVLKNNYKNYEDALLKLNLDTLADRREKILLKFANNGIKYENMCDLLKLNEATVNTRDKEKYLVEFANTERLKTSSIIHMQKMLNQDERNKRKISD